MFELQLVLLFPLIAGPMLARPRSRPGQAMRTAWLLGVFVLFVGWPVHGQAGWTGVLVLLALMYVAVSGPLHEHGHCDRRLDRMLVRRGVGVAGVFGGCVVSGALFGWGDSPTRHAWWCAFCLLCLAVYDLLRRHETAAPARVS